MTSHHPSASAAAAEPATLPRLAAVAVTFNSSKEIEAWVASFERSGMRDAIELCVVDSGSRTEEREVLVERIGPRVDTLLLRPNYGYGRSCNAGAAATRAGTLLFLNPDAELCSLPPRFTSGGLPDGLLLGAVKLLPGGGSRPLGFAHLPHAGWQAENLLLGRFSRAFRFTGDDPEWVSGAAMLVKRSDFEAIGGFADDIFLYYEDADLCARLRRRGGRVAIDPEFVIDHPGRASSSGQHGLDPVSKWSGRIFAARHDGLVQARLLYLLLIVYYLPRRALVALVRRLLGREQGGQSIGQLALDLLNVRRVLRRLGVPH